jgi:hypothetical protein
MNRRFEFVIRTSLALVAWSGVVLQLWPCFRFADGKSIATGVADYLYFFTNLTNLFIALVAIAPTVQKMARVFRWFASPMVAGCAAVSGVQVFCGYHFLLHQPFRGLQGLTDVLHDAVPALALVYGFLYLRGYRQPWWSPLAWCFYPIAYFIYALVRGRLTGIYPYWFMNVPALGYRWTLVYGLGSIGAFILIGYAFLGVTRASERWRRTSRQ